MNKNNHSNNLNQNSNQAFIIIAIMLVIVIALHMTKNYLLKSISQEVNTSNTTNNTEIQKQKKENSKIDVDNIYEIMDQVLNNNESILSNYSLAELRIIRNTIYARKGYIFKDKNLENYFKKKSWYNGNISDQNQVQVTLREVEFINIVKKYERIISNS
jgi:non-specific serine/threonine protein kinase